MPEIARARMVVHAITLVVHALVPKVTQVKGWGNYFQFLFVPITMCFCYCQVLPVIAEGV